MREKGAGRVRPPHWVRKLVSVTLGLFWQLYLPPARHAAGTFFMLSRETALHRFVRYRLSIYMEQLQYSTQADGCRWACSLHKRRAGLGACTSVLQRSARVREEGCCRVSSSSPAVGNSALSLASWARGTTWQARSPCSIEIALSPYREQATNRYEHTILQCSTAPAPPLPQITSGRSSPRSRYHYHTRPPRASIPLACGWCCCKSPLPLHLAAGLSTNTLKRPTLAPRRPGPRLNRGYQHSIGPPSCPPGVCSRARLALAAGSQWRRRIYNRSRARAHLTTLPPPLPMHAGLQVKALSSHDPVCVDRRQRWPLRRPGPSLSPSRYCTRASSSSFLPLGLQMSPGRSRRCKTNAWSSLLCAESRIPAAR